MASTLTITVRSTHDLTSAGATIAKDVVAHLRRTGHEAAEVVGWSAAIEVADIEVPAEDDSADIEAEAPDYEDVPAPGEIIGESGYRIPDDNDEA